MKHGLMKASLGTLVLGGVLAGCATTVDMGGPLGHYRYHYDSRPAVVYREPVVYRDPVVYREPVVTYSAPAVTYRAPVVYRYYDRVVTSYDERGQ
jgi:hypothetical protein